MTAVPITGSSMDSRTVPPSNVPCVLCLNGTRINNRRVAMFMECLQRDGYSIRIFALPRHRWIFDKSDVPLDVRRAGRCTAEIGQPTTASAAAIFCFHWTVLPLAVLLGMLRRIPVIYDEHDHYELNTLEGTGSPLKLRIYSLLVRWIHRLFLPRVRLVTCIHQCRFTLRRHLERWQPRIVELHNYPSQVWRNTVHTHSLQSRLCFVYIGGVYAVKGVLAAADAFQLLPETLRNHAELHIFGEGDSQLIAALRERSGVHVHNGVAPSEFRDFAVQHRCVGLALLADTPRYQLVGTNCTKLWEYLALGMPVIASDVGELALAVLQHHAGLVISASLDPDQLSGAMAALLQDQSAAADMARSATDLMQQPGMTWEDEWNKVRATGVLAERQAPTKALPPA